MKLDEIIKEVNEYRRKREEDQELSPGRGNAQNVCETTEPARGRARMGRTCGRSKPVLSTGTRCCRQGPERGEPVSGAGRRRVFRRKQRGDSDAPSSVVWRCRKERDGRSVCGARNCFFTADLGVARTGPLVFLMSKGHQDFMSRASL